MGGRFWFGVALLCVLLVAGLLLSGILTLDQQRITGLLEQAEAFAYENNMDSAVAFAQQAYDLWKQKWAGLAAIADHTPLDAAEAAFRELLAFGKTGENEEFCASCGKLISGVAAIGQAHELAWWNIL